MNVCNDWLLITSISRNASKRYSNNLDHYNTSNIFLVKASTYVICVRVYLYTKQSMGSLNFFSLNFRGRTPLATNRILFNVFLVKLK